MDNDDFYYHSKFDSEYSQADSSNVNNQYTLANIAQSSHYQSMDTIQKDKPHVIVRIGKILKIISTAAICILIFLSVLALSTHGNALFFDRVEGVVTEKEDISNHSSYSRSRSYKINYRIKVTYTYKGEEYTMSGHSSTAKTVGQKVYVYINRLNPSTILYIDNSLSLFIFILPATMFLFAVRAFSSELANDKSRTTRKLRDII